MPVRRVIIMPAVLGKGTDLAKALEEHSVNVRKEPGCLQFEAFQSSHDPDTICLLQLWTDQASLDRHGRQGPNQTLDRLRADVTEDGYKGSSREDYEYNRTR
jgi:quinol monooxygenase YgiN